MSTAWRTAFALVILPALLIDHDPAAPPGDWHRITELTGRNIDEATLARTPDGVLHLAWVRKSGTKWDLMHGTLDSAGTTVGASSVIVEGWASLSNPYLLVSKRGGLRVFMSGIRGQGPKDPYQGSIYTATAPASGTPWSLAEGGITKSHTTGAPGATITPDGLPAVAWSTSSGLFVHLGLEETAPDQKLPITRCCAYNPALATDAVSGEVVLGWYSNISQDHGLWAATVSPSIGEKVYAPGSARPDHSASSQPMYRTPVAARLGAPGIYLAYCSGYPVCERINLWRVGSAQPLTVTPARQTRFVNLAPGPEGRLWIMWNEGTTVRATRSNRAATRFGPIVSAAPPQGTGGIWKVMGEGSLGPIDLLASFSNAAQEIATWQVRLLPALTITASPGSLTAGDSAAVTFQVTDAGDPVAGASVTAGGSSGTTDNTGRFRMTSPASTRPGTITARASRQGYQDAVVRVAVKPPPPPPRPGP